jgi:hypothetical protein
MTFGTGYALVIREEGKIYCVLDWRKMLTMGGQKYFRSGSER